MWEKADKIDGFDKAYFRKDRCGNLICRKSYGQDELLGWHGDHIKPHSRGGEHHLNNFQALQSAQNKSKGDKYPYDYENVPQKGITPKEYACIQARQVDKQSLLYKTGGVVLNMDGSVNVRSEAVLEGLVTLNNDGSVRRNCRAINQGLLTLHH